MLNRMYEIGTELRMLALSLVAVVLVSMLPPTVSAADASATDMSKSDRVIVSLGDSYSSGEGIEPFYGQDFPMKEKVTNSDWLAHRSQNAWSGMLTLEAEDGSPILMSDNRNTNWFFAATSGATTTDIMYSADFWAMEPSERPKVTHKKVHKELDDGMLYRSNEIASFQLDIFDQLESQNKKADYVTLTLGGNDADFSGIISEVVIKSTYINFNALYSKLYNVWNEFFMKGGIADSLRSAYANIAEAAGPQATIIVAGYPQLLDSNGRGLAVTKEEATMVNDAVKNFNLEIDKIVENCRTSGMDIWFASVKDAFAGHEAYSKEPFINKVDVGPNAEDLVIFDPLDMDTYVSAYSMHPNLKGAKAYAECVQDVIDRLEGERTQGTEPDTSPTPTVEATPTPSHQILSQDVFNETYWRMATGVTNGSFYNVLFHADGTYEAINFTGSIYVTGNYSYQNGSLWVYSTEFGDTEYQYNSEVGRFQSVELFQMQSDMDHRSLSSDSEGSAERTFNNLVISRNPVFSNTDWSNSIFMNDLPNKSCDNHIENGSQPYAIEIVGNCDFALSLSGMDEGKTVAVVIFNNKEEVISQNYYCGNDSVIEIPDVSAGTIFYILVCSENQATHYRISWSAEESATGSASTNTNSSGMVWLNAYADILTSYYSTDGRFQLADLNGDNIPELLVATGWFHAAGVDIYTYNKDEVINVGAVGSFGEFTYYPSTNTICSTYAGMGAITNDFYQLNKDSLQLLCKLAQYEDWEDSSIVTFVINDNKVSENAYNKKFAELSSSGYAHIVGYSTGWPVNTEEITTMLNNYELYLQTFDYFCDPVVTYSADELVELAVNYYERHYGDRPPYAEVDHMEDDMFVIHLYDIVDTGDGGHTATYAWYKVDEFGVGTDDVLMVPVDLTS